MTYNFESFSQIDAIISGTNRYCTVFDENLESDIILEGFERGNNGINVLVLLFSTISLILSIKHIYSVATIYMTTRYFYKKLLEDKPKD